ncbi:MAG: hypothetical protein HFH82_16550 [Lachnospiraceae bacterium]|nr:hypothetical protein [Lachnospiraceae bacterium]
MDLPIPTHLQPYFIPVGDKNSEYEVTGKIHCVCGNEKFEVWESNERCMIQLKCSQCGEEILLFDAGKHGWNGFVCHEDWYMDRRMPYIKYNCPKCDKDSFGILVYISSQGKEDFIEECVVFHDSFCADDWVDGFECIVVSLSCENCNVTEENWAVFETM